MSDDTKEVLAKIQQMHSDVLQALAEIRELRDWAEAQCGIITEPLGGGDTERTPRGEQVTAPY